MIVKGIGEERRRRAARGGRSEFDENHEKDLEQVINDFIEEEQPEIFDIKYSVSTSIISEEQAFLKKAKIKDKDEIYKFQKSENVSRHPNDYNRLKTFQMLHNNENIKKEDLNEELKDDKNDVEKNNFVNLNQFILSRGFSKKVSISNINELQKVRIEHGARDENKRWTSNKKKIK